MILAPAGIFTAGLLLGFLIDCIVAKEISGESYTFPDTLGAGYAGGQSGGWPSYKFLWERWRCKAEKIMTALGSGVITLTLYQYLGWGVRAERFLFLCCFLQMAVLMEARLRHFPGLYHICLALTAFPPLLLAKPVEVLFDTVLVFLVVGGVLWGISRLTHGGVGKQDAKLAALTTLFLGAELSWTALFLTVLLCGIAGVVILAVDFTHRKRTLPFSPFLMAGVLLSIVM